jgi:hypothetical protein
VCPTRSASWAFQISDPSKKATATEPGPPKALFQPDITRNDNPALLPTFHSFPPC